MVKLVINKEEGDIMNIKKLKEAEENFFIRYPGGFSNPLMQEIAKKHKAQKMVQLAQESFSAEKFDFPGEIVDSMGKIVSRSSIISLFEKPKFRDLVKVLSDNEKESLAHGLKEFLYGDQELGFNMMAGLMKEYKLAKWPLLTVFGIYHKPDVEAFVKPTTAKKVIQYFELKDIKYSPNPTYEFYKSYRDQINQMKKGLDTSLQVDNAAFCGFLMMSIEK